VFAVEGGIYPSAMVSAGEDIIVQLDSVLTEQSELKGQLYAQDAAGTIIAKSPIFTLHLGDTITGDIIDDPATGNSIYEQLGEAVTACNQVMNTFPIPSAEDTGKVLTATGDSDAEWQDVPNEIIDVVITDYSISNNEITATSNLSCQEIYDYSHSGKSFRVGYGSDGTMALYVGSPLTVIAQSTGNVVLYLYIRDGQHYGYFMRIHGLPSATSITGGRTVLATKSDLDTKQDVITAGSGIDLESNVISAVQEILDESGGDVLIYTPAELLAAFQSGMRLTIMNCPVLSVRTEGDDTVAYYSNSGYESTISSNFVPYIVRITVANDKSFTSEFFPVNGGGGGGTQTSLVITPTFITTSDGTLDKTNEEIIAAVQASRNIMITYDNINYYNVTVKLQTGETTYPQIKLNFISTNSDEDFVEESFIVAASNSVINEFDYYHISSADYIREGDNVSDLNNDAGYLTEQINSDWNENDTSSPAYVQNRTHYGAVRTELVNTEWDGVFSSANAPTVDGNDYKEYTFYSDGDKTQVTTYLYRMSADNSTVDLTNLTGKIYVEQDGTTIINTIGTMTECVNSYIDWAIAQGYITEDQREMFLQLVQTTEITTVVDNVTIQDIGFYADEEPEFAFYVLYVAQEGDYNLIPTLYPNAGASYTGGDTHLYQGIYAYVPYRSVVANPISISSIVKLDRMYLPTSLEEDITNLQLAMSNLFYDISVTNVSLTSDGFTATSDKSSTEVYQAIASGKSIRWYSADSLLNLIQGDVLDAVGYSESEVRLYLRSTTDEVFYIVLTDYSMTGAMHTLEDTTNKVTSISSSSTDTEYPSALAVYNYVTDAIGDIDTLIGTGVIE